VAEQARILTTSSKETQPSKLFPALFRNLDRNRNEADRLTVLDVGSAFPGTVDHFSRYKCRIHFRDLYSEPLIRTHEQIRNEQEMGARFHEMFQFPTGTKFDICLFWDFLNYLNAPALRAFSAVLRPYMKRTTRSHGFGVHSADIRLRNQQFSIASDSSFYVCERPGEPLTYFAHPQTELYHLLGYLDIERGILLPDGKVEILLRTTI
jgi:hypothetical protein